MQEVECSKRIAKVRIHVERVIGLLKNKYTILQNILPVTLIKHRDDIDFAFIDQLLTVCSALINLSPSVVPSLKKYIVIKQYTNLIMRTHAMKI